jgi:hypothetical protein
LRIRPPPSAATSEPYIKVLSPELVEFTSPEQSATTKYRFTRVFGDEATQSDFFNETTRPMVQDVLNGQSGLLFAYGVSNSGKTCAHEPEQF